MSETVFRFQNVRPPEPRSRDASTVDRVVDPWSDDHPSALRDGLRDRKLAGGTRADLRGMADEFLKAQENQAQTLIGPEVAHAVEWAMANSNVKLSELDLTKGLVEQCGGPIVRETERRVADVMLAGSVAGGCEDLPAASGALKVCHLARELAAGRALPDDLALGEFLDRMFVVLPRDATPPAPPRPAPTPPTTAPSAERAATLRTRLGDLDTTYREVCDLILGGAVVVVEDRDGGPPPDPSRPHAGDKEDETASGPSWRRDPTTRLGFDTAAYAGLSDATRDVLGGIGPASAAADPFATVAALEKEIAGVAGLLAARVRPAQLVRVGESLVDVESLAGALGMQMKATVGTELPEGSAFLPSPTEVHCQYRAYVDDLLIVKQTLKAYELADFAHVENVMAGETRSREHRRLDLTESTTTEETEQVAETERDLQSTDRNEIQTEAKETVKEDAKLEAGLQVSGSYGPSISFQVDTKGSFSKSSEQSKAKAVTYSREVTDKAVEKTLERVREERKRRVLQEIEETNSHAFVGAQDNHTRGIYRWLNKKYEAQIFEYGQRLMLDLILPEPAAFYLYALVENPPSELAPPKAPTFEGMPLKPEHLQRTNYQEFVAAYKVRSVTPPPSGFTMVSVFEKQDGSQNGSFGRATKVTIKEGYEAVAARVNGTYCLLDSIAEKGKDSLVVLVGDQPLDLRNSWGRYVRFGYPGPQTRWRGEISVGFLATNVTSFVASVDIFCNLTTDVGMRVWQQDLYDAIMEAYFAMKSEYDEALTAQTFSGVTISGRNPLDNRRVEKDELKKLVVMGLLNDPSFEFNAFKAGDEPIFDPLVACANEPVIRFFEQAFEWNNMLYVFYPYFWGRRSRWHTLLNVTDADPDFAAFLRAGAVRVQVPVRTESAKAVAAYLQSGNLSTSSEDALFDDDVYVPIIEEITSKLGKPGEERPYGKDPEPWEVTVPTSLVVVQDLEEIPGILDALTGAPMDLTSSHG